MRLMYLIGRLKTMDLMTIGLKGVPAYQYNLRARFLYNIGFLELAEAETMEALRISPSSHNAYHLLGKLAMDKKDYQQAYVYLRQAKILGGRHWELYYDLAKNYYDMGKIEKAEQLCKLGLKTYITNKSFISLWSLIDSSREKIKN